MKIKQDDQVLIIAGKDKNRKGKVIQALPKQGRIVVEGMNIRKKHRKGRKEGEKGQTVEIPAPFSVSNVKLLCPKCGKPARIGYKIEAAKKYRICKKCQKQI